MAEVLRFWNAEVLTNIYGVEVAIMLAVGLLAENGVEKAGDQQGAFSAMERLRKKARQLVRAGPGLRQRKSHNVPSPLVGEGQGGGDRRTLAVVAPPTPNPSPQGGGESTRRTRKPAGRSNA